MKKAVTSCAILAIMTFTGLLLNQKIAFSTGGAFPYTKHGGGTTDGVTPFDNGNEPGVDRSVNADYSSYYHDQSLEAGKFRGGECNQCHEPHGSFGGSEPSPVNSSPSAYLLMRYGSEVGNYAELCWYCHDSMQLNSNPPGYGYWDFYQGSNIFQNSSHYISSNFYWPGTFGDPVEIWPRRDRNSLPTGNKGSCLNCHTPHGIMESSGNEFDTSAVPANNHLAANNESVSTDYLIPRQLIAWEEALCENCHDSSGPAPNNIQDEINKRATGSGHPVDDTLLSGLHSASEPTLNTVRHVECYDCHNPHAATGSGSGHTIGTAGFNRLKGMNFIKIDGVSTDPATEGRDPYIMEVCFRCHGDSYDCVMSYTAYGASIGTEGCTPLPNRHRGNENGTGINQQLGNSNKRVEFNPDTIIGASHGADNSKINGGYHPVDSPGRNRSIQLCNQLKDAFSLSCANQADADVELGNLTINCTDCHNNDDMGGDTIRGPITQSNLRSTDVYPVYTGPAVSGPHGSDNKRILRADYNTYISLGGGGGMGGMGGGGGGSISVIRNNSALCFRCHDETPFISSANSSWTNFYASGGGMGGWGNSLHYYHLRLSFSGEQIKCHECHNNVHSNVEANNTQYYSGSSCCTGFPADGNTHLINFGPQATPDNYLKPAWYLSSGGGGGMGGMGGGGGGEVYGCNLRCHGKTMSSCTYKGAFDGGPDGGGWC